MSPYHSNTLDTYKDKRLILFIVLKTLVQYQQHCSVNSAIAEYQGTSIWQNRTIIYQTKKLRRK